MVKEKEGENVLHVYSDEILDVPRVKRSLFVFPRGEVGFVIGVRNVEDSSDRYFRVLTSKGVGWVNEYWVERVRMNP